MKEVLVTIRDLAEGGMTCMLVTHKMGFVRELADHIYFTERGVIVEDGPPEEFFKVAKDPAHAGVPEPDSLGELPMLPRP